jgi:hypothetical protein
MSSPNVSHSKCLYQAEKWNECVPQVLTHGAHRTALTSATTDMMDELWARHVLPGRSSHSSTSQLYLSTFLCIRWVYWLVLVTKAAQVELESGRVLAPAVLDFPTQRKHFLWDSLGD